MSINSMSAVRNIGDTERTLSFVGGALLTYIALRKAPASLLLAGLGGYLLYRGAGAFCPLWDALGITSFLDHSPDRVETIVDITVEGSFPASDPPGYSTGSMFTQVKE